MNPVNRLSPAVVVLARALRCRIDNAWPPLYRNGVEVFASRQQFTVVDSECPAHTATFTIAAQDLSESALALAYAEVVHRFADAAPAAALAA